MRNLLLFTVVSALVACSSSSDSSSSSPSDGAGVPSGPVDPSNPTPEAPIAAHPVCAAVPTGDRFGEGCSGTGAGQQVCALEDAKCGADKCVYDSRDPAGFKFRCGAKCTVGDGAGCPLGYECVAPDPSCAGDAAKGVCSERVGSGCDAKVQVEDGRFFEGTAGETFHIRATADEATLSLRSGSTFRVLATWKDFYASTQFTVARSGNAILVGAPSSEVLIRDGKATAIAIASSGRRSVVRGVAADGAFVKLDVDGTDSFAALSRRGEDGTWSEVGPTRKRVSNVQALATGFVAICQNALCVSKDGESFETVALPPAATLAPTSPPLMAGASTEDFFAAIGGSLRHFRKGVWVEEGPRKIANAPSADSYQDRLFVSVKGTTVYQTWSGTKYTTYVSGNDCWGVSAGPDLSRADLVGDSFLSIGSSSSSRALCTTPAR